MDTRKIKLTHRLVLGSKSPRRAQLLSDMGFFFTVRVTDADESASNELSPEETAVSISEQKAKALQSTLSHDELGITSDTEVWLDQHRFGKPANEKEAYQMLKMLSGRTHKVVTGLTLVTTTEIRSYTSTVCVLFDHIPEWAIEHYISNFAPFDKAGAYGIQEWIGMSFISKIEGEYNAVVGLPTSTLFHALEPFRVHP